MSRHTKNLIIEQTLRLAEKKPINKITVIEIVRECDITRNTFYYHFHDIYDVFNTYLDEQIESLSAQSYESMETALFSFITLCAGKKRVWLNLYRTAGYDAISKITKEKLGKLIMLLIGKEYDVSRFSSYDIDIIRVFYEEAIFGVLLRWIKGNSIELSDELMERIERIKSIFRGQIGLLMENCSHK